jgi:hypothetical protein
MKHIHTFDDFLNEAKKDKLGADTYFEEVVIKGFGNINTIKAGREASKIGQAVADYLEKGKPFEKSGLVVKDISAFDLEKNFVPGATVETKIIDPKTDKDFLVQMEMRDTNYSSGTKQNNIYIRISRA